MQISKILSIPQINPIKIKKTSFKSSENQTNPIENSTFYNGYYGRELIKPQNLDFENTVSKNYFKLPEGASPDTFQKESAKALLKGYDVLAGAPTGTGKTAIAHYVVSKNMNEGKKTFYTTPIKALSNQKLNEFRQVYGDENVGILTGDRRENVEAPIIIMTTEVYRNMVLSDMYGEKNPIMDNLKTVIFDEFHYLGDESRGPVWEEAVMMTPQNVQKLALSATIGNFDSLNSWFNELSSSKSELVTIPEKDRHVPLNFDEMPTSSYKQEEKRIKKSIKKTGEVKLGVMSGNVTKPLLSDFKYAIYKLNKKEQLPAILFVFSKKYSRELLEYLNEEGEDLTTYEEKAQIEKIVNEYKTKKKYIGSDLDLDALKKGYAIHNAGIIPAQKELIEELFQKKLIKAVIATETLAAGINMPAKTVVISSPYKPCDDEAPEAYGGRPLTANEFKQMAGRAGRRGIDTIGYVYTMPTSKEAEAVFKNLELSQSNPVNSHYSPDYAFLAGYFEHNDDTLKLKEIYDKSFYVHSDDEIVRENKLEELLHETDKKMHIMQKRGLIKDNNGKIELTNTGYMASKVRGYNSIVLAETIQSKAFDKISPEALAMIAAGIANPASYSETSINLNTDFSPLLESTQDNIDSVYNRLYGRVNKSLMRLGKNINSFSSYDEIIDFVKSIEKPQIDDTSELNEYFLTLKEKMAKLNIIESQEKYSQESLFNDLRAGKTIPMQVLEEASEQIKEYQSSLKDKNIDEYIERLENELNSLSEQKGNKSKLLTEKKRIKIQNDIEKAKEMKYLSVRVKGEINKNNQYLAENKTLKSDYRECEKLIIKLTSNDVLLSMVKGLKSIDEYQFEHDMLNDNFQNYIKVSGCFKELLTRNAELFSDEMNEGIEQSPDKYNKNALRHVYTWAILNRINSDGMSNWKQVINSTHDETQEGVIYREILQSADLLSQIGEIAQAGYEKADNEADLQYYAQLKETAANARKLLINEPVTV